MVSNEEFEAQDELPDFPEQLDLNAEAFVPENEGEGFDDPEEDDNGGS